MGYEGVITWCLTDLNKNLIDYFNKLEEKIIDIPIDDKYEGNHNGLFAHTFDAPYYNHKYSVLVDGQHLLPGNPNIPMTISDDNGKVKIEIQGSEECHLSIQVTGYEKCKVIAKKSLLPDADQLVCDVCTGSASVMAYNSLQNIASFYVGNTTARGIFINSFTDNTYTGNDIATGVDLHVDICDTAGNVVVPVVISNGVTPTTVLLSQVNGAGGYINIPGAAPGDTYRVKIWWVSDNNIRIEQYTDICIPTLQQLPGGAAFFHHMVNVSTTPFDCTSAQASEIQLAQGGLNHTSYQIVSYEINGKLVTGNVSGGYISTPQDLIKGKNSYHLKASFSPDFDTTKNLESGLIVEFITDCI